MYLQLKEDLIVTVTVTGPSRKEGSLVEVMRRLFFAAYILLFLEISLIWLYGFLYFTISESCRFPVTEEYVLKYSNLRREDQR